MKFIPCSLGATALLAIALLAPATMQACGDYGLHIRQPAAAAQLLTTTTDLSRGVVAFSEAAALAHQLRVAQAAHARVALAAQ